MLGWQSEGRGSTKYNKWYNYAIQQKRYVKTEKGNGRELLHVPGDNKPEWKFKVLGGDDENDDDRKLKNPWSAVSFRSFRLIQTHLGGRFFRENRYAALTFRTFRASGNYGKKKFRPLGRETSFSDVR